MKVKTLGPVEHDGKKVKVGSTLDLDEAAADQLVAAGAAEPASTKRADTADLDKKAD